MRIDWNLALRGMVTAGLVTVLGLTALVADAQQATKVPRVGLLRPGSPPDPYVDAFRQGLRDRGYVEGQTIALEFRWAEGKSAIVTQGEESARAAKQATSAIPIVMATSGDPVGAGLVASLARPGGNVTGLSV